MIQNCQTKVYGVFYASLRYIERKSAVEANNYRSRKQNMIFQHFGRLPGTLKNVPCCLNELLVNFREEL